MGLAAAAFVFASAPARADILGWSGRFTCEDAGVVASLTCKGATQYSESSGPGPIPSAGVPVYGCVGSTRCPTPVGYVGTWKKQTCQALEPDAGVEAGALTCEEGYACPPASYGKPVHATATGALEGATCTGAAAYDSLCYGDHPCGDRQGCVSYAYLSPGTPKKGSCEAEDEGGCSMSHTTTGVGVGFALVLAAALLAQRRSTS